MAEEVIISAVLEMQAVAGFTAVAPIDSAKGLVIEKETIAKMELKDKATAFKDMAVSTLKDGTIKVKARVCEIISVNYPSMVILDMSLLVWQALIDAFNIKYDFKQVKTSPQVK
ncbi:MAG: hypothetical protein HUJ63_08275 [Enterococcus sp.]|nr:hypothetical protein [Enterococcus sp.]